VSSLSSSYGCGESRVAVCNGNVRTVFEHACNYCISETTLVALIAQKEVLESIFRISVELSSQSLYLYIYIYIYIHIIGYVSRSLFLSMIHPNVNELTQTAGVLS